MGGFNWCALLPTPARLILQNDFLPFLLSPAFRKKKVIPKFVSWCLKKRDTHSFSQRVMSTRWRELGCSFLDTKLTNISQVSYVAKNEQNGNHKNAFIRKESQEQFRKSDLNRELMEAFWHPKRMAKFQYLLDDDDNE